MKKQATVITGTIGMDVHVIGTKILSRALRDAGFNVVELGMQVPTEEFVEVAQETKADAILMTSLYGMAELDLRGFKEECKQAGLEELILFIGGVLGVGRQDFKEVEQKFKKLGFDEVYPPEADLKIVIEDLRKSLRAKGKA